MTIGYSACNHKRFGTAVSATGFANGLEADKGRNYRAGSLGRQGRQVQASQNHHGKTYEYEVCAVLIAGLDGRNSKLKPRKRQETLVRSRPPHNQSMIAEAPSSGSPLELRVLVHYSFSLLQGTSENHQRKVRMFLFHPLYAFLLYEYLEE